MKFDLEEIMKEKKHLMFFNLEEIKSFEKQIGRAFKEGTKSKILNKIFVLYFDEYDKDFKVRLQKDARERGYQIVNISEYLIEENEDFDWKRIILEDKCIIFDELNELEIFLKHFKFEISKATKELILVKKYGIIIKHDGKQRILFLENMLDSRKKNFKEYKISEKKEEIKLKNQEGTMGQKINVSIKVATINEDKIEVVNVFEETLEQINESTRSAIAGGKFYENVIQIDTDKETLLEYKEPKLETKDTRGQWVAVQTEITSHQLMSSCELETQEEALEKINILKEKLKNFSPTIEKKIIF